ncbi:MAG: alpha/beta hydrolase [Deltaproteobacteria bacterium]|jgi:pimeloyl-ACP methyl ester carboxylesterase|nr:alpha/beta hydrolase [Deltaproteobacteria bacterium]
MPVEPIDDLPIYYEVHGQGPTLILIHGLGSSHLDWEHQVEFLAEHFQIVTIDLRGHGKSGKPPGPYSVSLFASDVAKLIRSLRLAPAHVAGISMGGMVAFQLAIDAPELLKSLVIINSGPALVLRTTQERAAFFLRGLIIRCLGMGYLAQMLGKMLLPEPHQKSLQIKLINRWSKNDKKAYLASLRAITGWSVEDHISAIQCPSLIMSADNDYTPVGFKQAYLSKMIRAELVVIRNSRHLSPIDQPKQVNNAILKFLSSL